LVKKIKEIELIYRCTKTENIEKRVILHKPNLQANRKIDTIKDGETSKKEKLRSNYRYFTR
jgi:hypothetical protein